MSAFTKLAEFVYKLPEELQPEFMQLVDAVTDERDRLQNERLANSIKYNVVAIAGTAEQLLSDTINVGDTVELRESNYNPLSEIRDLDLSFNKVYLVDDTYVDTEGTSFVTVEGNSNEILAKRFRKVSTPIVNPLNSVEGC